MRLILEKQRKKRLWRRLVTGIALSASLTVTTVHAAEPIIGMVPEPCPAVMAMPVDVQTLLTQLFIEPGTLQPADLNRLLRNEQFQAFDKDNRQRASSDWSGRCRYWRANQDVRVARQRPRAVFMGDSITENWNLADGAFFSNGIVNRGISAQTSAQMLLRLRTDVVALRPEIVHILAGTNDIAGNNGPTSASEFQGNIQSMVEIARANGIRVVLGSIPPTNTFSWQPALRPAPQVRELNQWLRSYAQRNGIVYVDYYAALTGGEGQLRAEFGNDGVHPNRAGYVVMRRLAEAALTKAAAQRAK
jgi:lysophospholipase L1-like esterase